MKLAANILRFEDHLRRAQELAKMDLNDYFVYTALAMECFQAVNALIEVAEHVVVQQRLGVPSSYREVFEILYGHGWLTAEELQAAKRLVFLRNVIAHEYQKIQASDLQGAANLLVLIHGFIRRVGERAAEKKG
ncbi:MAG: DUF86 domain-containing protein [Candidatus Bipolaricaulota bacterium]|nr:DUF86 domain-containing protein [Candidatus Bipolaricaulota bacterium]